MRTLLATIAALAGVLCAAGPAGAGPDWKETSLNSGDAGSLPGTSQVPHGQPPASDLETISGSLSGAGPTGPDMQDMYAVYIIDPDTFSATVSAGFDVQLYLFSSTGCGVLGNNGPGFVASFGNASNDGSGSMVAAPGLYYLAISPFPSEPLSSAFLPLFMFDTPGEISGPDGPGGFGTVASWTTAIAPGGYIMTLDGTAFLPCLGDVTFDGLVNVEDLVAVILAWGECRSGPCDEDINGDGEVNVEDLVIVILNWEICTPNFVPPVGTGCG